MRTLEERTLETVAVRPSQSVWTVEAQCVETGTLYGIATDARAGARLLEALSELGEPPPVLSGVESWQILWSLSPEEQHSYWEEHWREQQRSCDGCGRLEPAHTAPDQDSLGRSDCCSERGAEQITY